MTSYNQVIALLKSLSDAHQQLKSFGAGDPWEFAANGDVTYPAMWVAMVDPEEIDIDSNNSKLYLKLIFSDLVQVPSKENEQEVLSDMEQVGFDILSQLQRIDGLELDPRIKAEPFTDAFTDQVSGWVFNVGIRRDYLNDFCGIPSIYNPTAETACAPVTIFDSTGTNVLGVIVSGGVFIVSDSLIKNSAGTIIGVITAQGTIILSDKTLTNSDASLSSPIIQGINKTLADITVINYDSTTLTKPGGVNVASKTLARGYRYPKPTGQTTSYRTGDDAYIQQNQLASLSRKWVVPLIDFSTLSENNTFNNTNRFTDENGLQVYGSNYLVDNDSGLGWWTIMLGSSTWNAAVDDCLNTVRAGFNDWFLPNYNQIDTLLKQLTTQGLNYAPFNFTGAFLLWTSTTHPSDSSVAFSLRMNSSGTAANIMDASTKASTLKYMACRIHFKP